jgi:hypothetical protein
MIKLGAQPGWTKSSYTVQNACVEVRSTDPASLDMTDSKFRWGREGAPVMSLSPDAFASLVALAAADARVS